MKNKIRITVAILLVVFIVGCVSWQKTTLISYQVLGESLISVRTVLESKCNSGEIPVDKCEEIKASYNKAVDLYKEAGIIALTAIDFEDKAKEKRYFEMKLEILTLIKEWQSLN